MDPFILDNDFIQNDEEVNINSNGLEDVPILSIITEKYAQKNIKKLNYSDT